MKRYSQRFLLAFCSLVLFTTLFVPFSNAKASENQVKSVNENEQVDSGEVLDEDEEAVEVLILDPEEQAEVDKLSALLAQSFVKNEMGLYSFDVNKAKELGLTPEEIELANHLFTDVLSQKDIKKIVGDNAPDIVTYSKAKIAAKTLAATLKKYGSKVDSAIDKGIDLLPIKEENKKKYKTVITTVALVKVLNNFIGVTDTVENLVVRGIQNISAWYA
ncbi:hypothetical protein [Peribacillus sp. R9-11]|uniref:hypothetical protein n=1 Tax=Peribacillus sp. R9-11 TaxID=3073271 RepID=UPI0028685218|nr:hypothetical protein [Peribacillus sp. R9-11]WMX58533.1 hypothetical protein RE409_28890 [Peribacillus sp. R9-11]